MKQQIRWPRALLEGVVIVASILAAFGVEAWWETRGERTRRGALMDDLRTELVRNAADVSRTVAAQRLRVERIDLLLAELTPDAAGLTADSVRALQAELVAVTSYDPSLGVLDLLLQSGDLALLENRELRARLAGLSAVSEDYISNQTLLIQNHISAESVLGTGSILFDVSDIVPGDTVLTTASPAVRVTTVKLLVFDRGLTQLMIGQGEGLHGEFEALLGLMEPG